MHTNNHVQYTQSSLPQCVPSLLDTIRGRKMPSHCPFAWSYNRQTVPVKHGGDVCGFCASFGNTGERLHKRSDLLLFLRLNANQPILHLVLVGCASQIPRTRKYLPFNVLPENPACPSANPLCRFDCELKNRATLATCDLATNPPTPRS